MTPTTIVPHREGPTGPSQPQAHEFVFNRDRSPRTGTAPTSTIGAGRQGNNVPPSVNILGATSRLNAQIQDGIAIPVTTPPRRGRQSGEGNQTITDVLPIVEASSDSTSGPSQLRRPGIPTPNLHFAELGHQQQVAAQPTHLGQHDGMDTNTPLNSHINTMDLDQWSVLEAGSSSASFAGPPVTDGSGNQWNMRRTLRDVFHFGRNPQEDLQQPRPPPPHGRPQPRP